MAANWKQLRPSPASVPASASILSLHPVKASFKGNCRKVIHFKLRTRRLIWLSNTLWGGGGGGYEAHTAIIVAGRDYLLQDNERLNYRREQSFLRNIKRLPVRSEELSRRNRFHPPPRGEEQNHLHVQNICALYRAGPSASVSHREAIIFSKNILYNLYQQRIAAPFGGRSLTMSFMCVALLLQHHLYPGRRKGDVEVGSGGFGGRLFPLFDKAES